MSALIKALISSGNAETLEEAKEIKEEMVESMQEVISNGGCMFEAEQVLSDYGLEPDYLMELI